VFYLDRLSPATLRVYATALEHRRTTGEPPSTELVVNMARAEGASVGAVLVLTRYELLAPNGKSAVPLGDFGWPPGVVEDVETIYAILSRGLPAAEIVTPAGKTMEPRKLDGWAQAWEIQGRLGEW
jgi:hypothetical protein